MADSEGREWLRLLCGVLHHLIALQSCIKSSDQLSIAHEPPLAHMQALPSKHGAHSSCTEYFAVQLVGKSDAYCVVELGDSGGKTEDKVEDKDRAVQWGETFNLFVP